MKNQNELWSAMRKRWLGSDKGLWARKAIGIIVMLVIFLRLVSGPLPIRVGFYALLFGECALIIIPRQAVRRPLIRTAAILGLCDVLFMVALGGPVASTAQLLWPMAVWIASVAEMEDVVATVLYILISIVIVLSNNLASIAAAAEGLGLAATFFGMHASRLQRMEHAQLIHANRALEEATISTMARAATEERMRIARDMHDGVGHQLTSLIVQLEAAKYAIQGEDDEALEMTNGAITTARDALAELRSVVQGFERDDEIFTLSAMTAMMHTFESTTGCQCQSVFEANFDDWTMPSMTVMYRALQEALTNVTRHTKAQVVRVHLYEDGQRGVMTVEDDGVGVDIQSIRLGFGLRGMRDRCQAAGGSLSLYATNSQGLGVRVTIPKKSEPWEETM